MQSAMKVTPARYIRTIWLAGIFFLAFFGSGLSSGQADCIIISNSKINIRQLPSTASAISGTLNPRQAIRANGQIVGDDGMVWWRMEDGSWVRSDVVTEDGDCSALPQVTPPSGVQQALNTPGAVCVHVDRSQLVNYPQPDAQLIILDRSGSMRESTRSGQSRMSLARDVLTQYIADIPDGTYVGLRAYGFGDSCSGSRLLYETAIVDQEELIRIVRSNASPDGTTPIAYSLEQIPADLAGFTGSKEVLLVTDGGEQCNGDPVAVAQRLALQDPRLSISVIGFDIQDAEAQQNLRNIPLVARGTYVQVATQQDLLQAMSVIIRLPFDVYRLSGELLDSGFVNRLPVSTSSGSYSVDITDLGLSDIQVFVENGRGTSIEIDAVGSVSVIENDPGCAAELCPKVPLPRLVVGEQGRVNEDDPGQREPRRVRVRTAPGLDNAEIGQLAILEEFEVLDGPICVDGYLWWEIRNDRIRGWSAEGVEGNYFIEPVS